MKLKNASIFVGLILALTLGFCAVAPAAPNAKAAPVPSAQPAASQPMPAAQPVPPHPEIREALGALRRARQHLAEARHDFGGHREDALRATDEAIRQLEICLKYD